MRFSPQKLLQTPGRQKASVARLIPRCSSPPRAPAAHLLPRLPELHRQRCNRSPSRPKRGGNSSHTPSPGKHLLPELPGSRLRVETSMLQMREGLARLEGWKEWSFWGYFCSDPGLSLAVWLLFKISLRRDFWGYCGFLCHMKSLWGSVIDGC